jgi:RNA polymerase sigma-70 factor (ECF subfamily)
VTAPSTTKLASFQAARRRLLSLAYRMLGSSADADDVVQEAWLRWQPVDEARVRNAEAWLCTSVTHLCLDRLKALRIRRAAYVGPWLPEPVQTDQPIERESISLAFLTLLERLTPVERAVYLLHRVFEHTHREVAEIVGMTEAAARQAFHRAEQHIADGRPRFAASAEEHARLLSAFHDALIAGDLDRLTRVLSADAGFWADAGGKVRGAATRPIHGNDSVARFLHGLVRMYLKPEQSFEQRTINGWPTLVGVLNGRVNAVLSVETDGREIVGVRHVINPDKLQLRALN